MLESIPLLFFEVQFLLLCKWEILRNLCHIWSCVLVWELVRFMCEFSKVGTKLPYRPQWRRSSQVILFEQRSFFHSKWFQRRIIAFHPRLAALMAASQTSDSESWAQDWAQTSIRLCLGYTGEFPNHRIRRNQAMIDGLAAVDRAIGTSAA